MALKTMEDQTSIYCVYFIGFMDLFSVSIGLPLFTRRARELGASPSIVGLIASIYGGIQLFSSPMMGKFSDTTGRKKVLVISLLGAAVGYFFIGLADSLLLMALARIPVGIFKQTQGMCKACLADITTAIERPKVFGNFNAICSLGFVVGPLIGGHLAMTQNGFFRVMTLQSFLFVFLAAFVAFVLKLRSNKGIKDDAVEMQGPEKNDHFEIHGSKYTDKFVLKEEKEEEEISKPDPKVSSKENTIFSKFLQFFKIQSLGSMVDLLMLRFVLGFSMILFRSNFTTVLEYRYQTTPKTNGYIMSYNGIVSGTSGALMGYIMSFYNHQDSKALFHFAIILTSCIFFITYSPDLWVLLLFIIPLSFSTAISRVCITNLTLTRGHKDERGVILGVGSSLLSFARMLSPLMGGLALEYSVYGPGTMSVIIASIGVAIAAFPAFKKKQVEEKKEK